MYKDPRIRYAIDLPLRSAIQRKEKDKTPIEIYFGSLSYTNTHKLKYIYMFEVF